MVQCCAQSVEALEDLTRVLAGPLGELGWAQLVLSRRELVEAPIPR